MPGWTDAFVAALLLLRGRTNTGRGQGAEGGESERAAVPAPTFH
ncbi:hypothetical protein ACFXG1_21295 [Streptomyces sp. NPDC059248]